MNTDNIKENDIISFYRPGQSPTRPLSGRVIKKNHKGQIEVISQSPINGPKSIYFTRSGKEIGCRCDSVGYMLLAPTQAKFIKDKMDAKRVNSPIVNNCWAALNMIKGRGVGAITRLSPKAIELMKALTEELG